MRTDRKDAMSEKGFAPQPKWLQGKCPFCLGKLSTIEKVSRGILKKYKCKNCNAIIDERFIHR